MSQNKKIREHLESGKAISTFTAIRKFHCTRLSARIKNLRDEGMVIYGKMHSHGGKQYKVYYTSDSPHFEAYGVHY